MFAVIHAAQICRNDELIPKDLLPKISKAGTVRPIPLFIERISNTITDFLIDFYISNYDLYVV